MRSRGRVLVEAWKMFSERMWNNNNHSKRYPFGLPITEARATLRDPRVHNPIQVMNDSQRVQRQGIFYTRVNKGMKPHVPKQYEGLLKEASPKQPATSPIKKRHLTLKDKKMQHYVAPLCLNRRAYHRSQPLEMKRQKDEWITTNAAMLKPNKPQPGVERCSWAGPESDNFHFNTYHHSLLKNLHNVNTEYKQEFRPKVKGDKDDSDSETDSEDEFGNDATSSFDGGAKSTPVAMAREGKSNEVKAKEAKTNEGNVKSRRSRRSPRVSSKKHPNNRDNLKKRVWKLRKDKWRKGPLSGSTMRDSYQEQEMKPLKSGTRRRPIKTSGRVSKKTIFRESFKPVPAELLVYRKRMEANDDLEGFTPSDRMGLVHRWPSRKNIFEFLETARPTANRIPAQPSPRQNARKRRDHMERYNKEVAAKSWVHKHQVGAFNR